MPKSCLLAGPDGGAIFGIRVDGAALRFWISEHDFVDKLARQLTTESSIPPFGESDQYIDPGRTRTLHLQVGYGERPERDSHRCDGNRDLISGIKFWGQESGPGLSNYINSESLAQLRRRLR